MKLEKQFERIENTLNLMKLKTEAVFLKRSKFQVILRFSVGITLINYETYKEVIIFTLKK